MDFTPKGDARPRPTLSPTRTTDTEKAAKLYSASRQPVLGGDSSDVRIKTGSMRLSDGNIVANVTMPISPPGAYRRVKLNRDRDRPLEFDGKVLAEVNEGTHDGAVMLRAAIYETKAGKYINELTRFEVEPGVDYGNSKPPYLFAKAEVFDSRDVAAMWFRTKGGRLTMRLMDQLGDVDSEFVD